MFKNSLFVFFVLIFFSLGIHAQDSVILKYLDSQLNKFQALDLSETVTQNQARLLGVEMDTAQLAELRRADFSKAKTWADFMVKVRLLQKKAAFCVVEKDTISLAMLLVDADSNADDFCVVRLSAGGVLRIDILTTNKYVVITKPLHDRYAIKIATNQHSFSYIEGEKFYSRTFLDPDIDATEYEYDLAQFASEILGLG